MIKKLQETMTEEEFAEIMKATKKDHHKLAFALGFYQCMRVSEVVKLKPEHVDRGMKLIRIKEAKGLKDRNIPIMPQLQYKLKGLPVGCGIRALEIAFKGAVKRAGINKSLHFHSLRHSGATHYLKTKMFNLIELQRFLGHSSVSTTQIYLHISADDLVRKVWGD